MNQSIMALVVILLAFGISPLAKADSACDQLLSITSLPQHDITAENVIKAFKNFFSSPSELKDTADKKLVYTTNSGYALVSKCQTVNRYERSMYYPIGIYGVLLGEEKITTDGKKVNYAHILTEYGLNIYVPRANIDFMTKDDIYIFSNSNNPTEYCAGRPKCTIRPGRELHPTLRFAKVAAEQRNKVINDKNNNTCGIYGIIPIQSGNIATGENGAKLSTCLTEESGEIGINGNLKIVWAKEARVRMSEMVKGSFARLSPKLARSIMDVLALSNIKECSSEKNITETVKFGVSGKIPTEIISAGASAEKVAKYTSKIPGDYYFRTSAFSWNIAEKNDFDIENIAFVSKCKDIRPFESLYITIYSKYFPNEQFQLLVDDLSETYIKYLQLPGFQRNSDSNSLMQGRFWNISDHSQYFKWRGVIRFILKKSKQMDDFLIEYSPEKKDMIRDFITHIVLASSFSYGSDPEKMKPII